MAAKGTFLAVAGQVGWDAQQHLVDGGFLTQFEQALRNVAAVVEAAGGSASDVVSLTIYVVDCREYTADLAAVGGAYRRVMGRHFPAMALVQVAALLEEGARVEIQGLAVLPEGSP
jgi:enamine deaminase RidA (YjgF/YER057c/UK114 family)